MKVKLKLVRKVRLIDDKRFNRTKYVAEGYLNSYRISITKFLTMLDDFTYKESFYFMDLDKHVMVGIITVHTDFNTKRYDCDDGLTTDYLGDLDNLSFLLDYIYYNPCWKEKLESWHFNG
jgi:hypothetical protein